MNEKSFRDLISGQTRGAAATLARGGLRLLSPFYGCGVRLRNAGFHCGLHTIHRAPVPVVSIGNLTTGGTGKTPFAAYLAHWFREHDRQVCFLSRGYRAESGQVNDEARVLEQLCPNVPHLQNPNRVASAQTAVAQFDSEILILDDGFQHRRLHRDLDIALIDAVNPWGYGYLLPRGLLREPRTGLRRADVVVITRVDQVDEDRLAAIRRQIAQYTRAEPVEISFPPVRLINAAGQTAEINSLHGLPLAVFCGIGNPTAFQAAIETLGLTIAAFREFPDHHPYGNDDVTQLKRWAADTNAAAALVTQKDLVKLNMTELNGVPLWALEIGCKINRGEETLSAALTRLTQSSTASDSAEA
ncbi:Tetraacyldisaccharide 4'-kinase [Symmachiella macrocystis]|uniref:Tetraacyldisaccharide 4'-kinase n=1 Tax=Symmachiella macrocystis TaxID=2527985 RepID=A0A5C6BNE3_9PLAN|nr:tetraacyldisaccharide 4'-kinase [Symmachiella macrocystis]TWU13670.1 Tetraacyldisaccharide 4'-kinase [Symmachiella macrocystis]